MKKQHLTIWACLGCLCLMTASCATKATVEGQWKLVWQENFNQRTTPDTAVWSKIKRGRSEWDKYMSDHDGCYAMRQGKAVLRGIVNPDPAGDTATYITGGITTMGKRQFHDGLIEVRAKLQSARGAWPAIWLLPEGGKWPDDGEIDIMERLNGDSIAHQTIHSYYTYRLHKTTPFNHKTGPIDPHGYNVYSVDLHKDSVTFYINGQKTFSYPRIETEIKSQFPYDRPYYLLIDMQLGGDWVGKIDPADLPVEMLVDYVRFYKRSGDAQTARRKD